MRYIKLGNTTTIIQWPRSDFLQNYLYNSQGKFCKRKLRPCTPFSHAPPYDQYYIINFKVIEYIFKKKDILKKELIPNYKPILFSNSLYIHFIFLHTKVKIERDARKASRYAIIGFSITIIIIIIIHHWKLFFPKSHDKKFALAFVTVSTA